MGKLQIGSMTEMNQRITAIEETEVVKTMDVSDTESDVLIKVVD